ncbi:TPA: porin [Vibrio parahaemolyticus]|uniref:porin n=1 Tax=Vibrio parahaemolyticus TaxID=670 RepID=UPI002269EC35|nr:porin [Vibrio parahaemolyticus]EKC5522310.1 porin [Vibrio parahaemolyticus]MCX8880596.1 porin [Vibrio parahaemolyticus]HCE5296381.1 porin [Vibrio parahaemolyticus]
MKMKTLAVAVAALACGSQAFAAEVYNSEGTSLSIGGHVSVGVGEYFEEDVRIHDVSPRINVGGKQDIGNGVTVDAKGEWSIKLLDGGESSFNTRLGYIGATHEQFGRVVAGTQWSPYYDVAGVADLPIAFANDFLYADQYNLGSARAERMLSYRKGFEFGEGFGFNLGLGWQGEHDMYDARGQIALSTELAGFGLGYVYSGGDHQIGTKNESATSHVFSANYGKYGSGLYAAVVYGMNEYFYLGLPETVQLEGLLAYGVNDWTFSVNYEGVENDKDNKTLKSETALQAEYSVTPSFVTFVGYQFDLGNDYNSEENDYWTLGARYYF